MAVINSPFRYAGGKFYARKLILEQLIPHTVYVEPFAGGASIFFAKEKVVKSILNDVDFNLINCYNHIRDNVEELIALLDGHEATKEKHHYFKNVYQPTNNLERAFRWYYLNRTSYSGIMNATNCYWGYGAKYSMQPHNWPTHLRRCSAKLQGVELTCQDFKTTIENAPDGALLFVDPPYFNADQDKFYTHSFALQDHYRLAELLREHSHRLKFLLTYDNSPEVLDMYSWTYRILEKEWNYTISRTDDQKKKTEDAPCTLIPNKGKRDTGKEVFILNYEQAYYDPPFASQSQLPLFSSPSDLSGASEGHPEEKPWAFAG